MHLHTGNQGGVWTTTSSNNHTLCPCLTPGTLWIISLKKDPGIFTHDSRPINFTLVVDDFGVKYSGKENAIYLKAALEDKYKVTTDWEVKLYIVI